jgi:hypothetical protein
MTHAARSRPCWRLPDPARRVPHDRRRLPQQTPVLEVRQVHEEVGTGALLGETTRPLLQGVAAGVGVREAEDEGTVDPAEGREEGIRLRRGVGIQGHRVVRDDEVPGVDARSMPRRDLRRGGDLAPAEVIEARRADPMDPPRLLAEGEHPRLRAPGGDEV